MLNKVKKSTLKKLPVSESCLDSESLYPYPEWINPDPHHWLCVWDAGTRTNLSQYFIQHCFICRPSASTVSENAGIQPRTVATTALAVRRSNYSAIYYPQTRQYLIHKLGYISSTNLAISHPQTRLYLIHKLGNISSSIRLYLIHKLGYTWISSTIRLYLVHKLGHISSTIWLYLIHKLGYISSTIRLYLIHKLGYISSTNSAISHPRFGFISSIGLTLVSPVTAACPPPKVISAVLSSHGSSSSSSSGTGELKGIFSKMPFSFARKYEISNSHSFENGQELHTRHWCCGSGSRRNPFVFGPPGSGSFYHQAKIVSNTLISTVLWLYDFLSLKKIWMQLQPEKSRKTLEGQWRNTDFLRCLFLFAQKIKFRICIL